MREQEHVGFIEIAKTVFGAYPRRTVVGLSLFIGQAFLYNAVFFTYALVLGTFYDVKPASVGWYIIPFALGNFVGPADPRAAVRQRRPQADDRRHLHPLRRRC